MFKSINEKKNTNKIQEEKILKESNKSKEIEEETIRKKEEEMKNKELENEKLEERYLKHVGKDVKDTLEEEAKKAQNNVYDDEDDTNPVINGL